MLVTLQLFQVVFLWLHDWLPLGRLNNTEAARAADGTARLARTTLLQALPFTLLLLATLGVRSGHLPPSLWTWLLIGYGLLFAGEIRAWWIPYFLRREPGRARRYRTLFARTHAFLPERNGITPNTLHCVLHLTTLATLVVLLTPRF